MASRWACRLRSLCRSAHRKTRPRASVFAMRGSNERWTSLCRMRRPKRPRSMMGRLSPARTTSQPPSDRSSSKSSSAGRAPCASAAAADPGPSARAEAVAKMGRRPLRPMGPPEDSSNYRLFAPVCPVEGSNPHGYNPLSGVIHGFGAAVISPVPLQLGSGRSRNLNKLPANGASVPGPAGGGGSPGVGARPKPGSAP